MPYFIPFHIPGPDYDEGEERLFRNDLSVKLLELQASLEESQKSKSLVSALTTGVSVGKVDVMGDPAPSFGSFSKGWGTGDAVTHTITKGAANWFNGAGKFPTEWTSNYASGWEEIDGDTGTFQYTGDYPNSGRRNFLVQWGMNLWYYSPASYLGLSGRILDSNAATGGALLEVPGSAQTTSWEHYGSIYLGNYYYMNYVSGAGMVAMAPDDYIKFEYGVNSVVGTGSTTVVAYRTYESGATLNITPLD